MKEEKNIYVGNRYVPKIMGEWNKQEPYEGLSIVTFEGTSYTSKKRVPIGIELTNEEYWTITGNYNAQIENYRQEVKKNTKDLIDYKVDVTTQFAKTMILSSDFGLVGDGTDETVKFQTMINASVGKQLKILSPQSKYKIGAINIPNDLNVFFEDGAVFEITSGLAEGNKWFDFTDKKNISFIGRNIVFQMLKEEYITGEHRHCFNFEGCENIIFRGITAKGSGGDGFYIGNANASVIKTNKKISLYDCLAENNKRQGMSVTSVEGLYVEKSTFSNTKGTNPQCGLDIEPNKSTDKFKNIRFVDCDFKDNAGRGVDIMLKALNENSDFVDIEFLNCRTIGNVHGFQPKYFNKGAKGEVRIINCKSSNEKLNAVNALSCHSESVKVVVQNHMGIDCNTNNGTDQSNSYGTTYLVNDISIESREEIGNISFLNCRSYDTRLVPLIRRGFATVTPNGVPIKNVDFIDCESTGHTVSDFEISQKTENILFYNKKEEEIYLENSGLLNTRYMNKVHTNRNATKIVSLTLPLAKNGFIFNFRVESANLLKLNPQTESKILTVTNDISKSVECSVIGSSIKLKGRKDGNWEVVNLIGQWTQSI